MSSKKGKNVKKIYSIGLMVHTCLALTTKGLPLGLLDQKIFSRKPRKRNTGKAKLHNHLPIEEKESYRWLEACVQRKAGIFSRRHSCQGKNQKPFSLDGRLEGNQRSEAHRQSHLLDG